MSGMDRYYERLKEKQGGSSASSSGGMNRYYQNQYYKSLDTSGVDDKYINSFSSDVSSFFEDYKGDKLSYTDANTRLSEFNTRYDTIQAWLYQNKNKLQEDSYKGLSDSLNSVKTGLDAVKGHYSQWGSEDEYNRYVSNRDYDLDAGLTELEGLMSQVTEYTALKSELQSIYDTAYKSLDAQGITKDKDKAKMLEQMLPNFPRYQEIQNILATKYADFNLLDATNTLHGKDQAYKEAKTFQETQALLYPERGEEFDQYVQAGKEVDNPTWNESLPPVDIFGIKPQGEGEEVNNWLAFFEESYNDKDNLQKNINPLQSLSGKGSAEIRERIDLMFATSQMSEDEQAIYHYYVGKGDTENAEKYLDYMVERYKQAKAQGIADKVDGKLVLEPLFSAAAGLDQFFTGVGNLDNYIMGTEADPITTTQRAYGITSSNNTGLWKVSNDLVNTTAHMLPTIIVSAVTEAAIPTTGEGVALGAVIGGAVGSITLGASATGSAYAEMRNLGYDANQARLYATLVGASEAGLQYLMGGISKLGGVAPGGLTELVLSKVDNAFARVAIQLGGSMLGEFSEEALQTVLEPWFKSIATDTAFDAPGIDEVLYSGLLGALSAGLLEGGGTVVGAVQTYAQGKSLMKNGVTSEALAKIGSTFSADTVAHQLAGRVDENTGAYTIARLFNEVNAELTEANQNDIIRSLERKGIAPRNAKTIATALADVVAGAELSPQQQAALDNNPAISKTFLDVIINENSTVNQRMQGFKKAMFGEKMANEMTEKVSTATTITESASEAEARATEIEPAESGKTLYKGEEVSVKRIVSTDGGIKVELDNGETVNASDLSLSSKEEALMYEMVARMETTPDTANEILKTFKPTDTKQAAVFYASVPLAYTYGKMNYKEGLKNTLLSTEQKQMVFNRGRADAITATKTNKTAHKADKTSKNGIIFESGFTYDESKATDIQKVSMAYIEAIDKMSNIEVHVFESKIENGKRVAYVNGKKVSAPNGYYQNGNQIYIDINAGNKGEGIMLITMAHEITHYIREWNAKGFKELADFLIAEYGKKGVPVNALLEAQKEKIKNRYEAEGKALPSEAKLADMAYEELVADAMSDMLSDPKAYEKLAKLKQKNRTLWEKVGEAIKAILDKFKTALGIYKDKPVSQEAYFVRDFAPNVYEKLQDLYLKAFVEADNNYTSAEKTLVESGIAVNPDTESASLMSVRDVLSEDQRQKVASALATRFGVTQKEAMDWLKAETSMASLILNPKYSQYLDYTPDPNEVAIKQNSDYPQGTVDFSPICAKRREFTSVMNNILRLFPNHVFAATDLAKIRSIMQEEGMTIPCGICYVEDRRQLDTIVAQNFIDSLKLYREGSKTRPDGKTFNANQLKGLSLIDGDSYTPSVYELVSLEGLNLLKEKNPNMAEAWIKFNNARGMQSVRLLANEAEYKRQILKYTKQTVKSKNDKGGLRVYSFSDAEMFHLIDIIQVITDSATVGLSLQGYTKVNEYARAVKDTGEKLNRSLIPKGELGYHIEDGKVVLDYDTVEGIDINHPDFFDNKDNPNVGNITIGVSDVQIRAAMVSDFVDQIIPFHTGQSEEVLGEKGISTWSNYKDFQTEKDIATGKVSEHQINIYTEVLQVLEKAGKPITKRTFVEKFLQVCKENGLTPRFSQFLNTNENGEYVYTEGYHKMLVDFKTFAQTEVGEYLPQMPVKPIFDNEYITGIMKDYVRSQKVKDAELSKSMPKVIERITNEIVQPSETKFSDRDSEGNTLSKEQIEFFKDSQVRDKNGNLMVMYHGTTANFNTFKKGDVGFHFGTKGAARGRVGFGKNVTLKEVYLNITNPIVFDEDLGSWDADYELTKKLFGMNVLTRAEAESVLFTDNKLYRRSTEEANKKLSALLQSKGYDGIVYKNTHEGKKDSTSYIVFNSNQAKEITNKVPTSDPDIRYSDRTPYSYEALTSKPDMKITTLGGVVPNNRADVVAQAKKNAASVGKTNKDGSVSVYVKDVDADVILSKRGLLHGLDRRFQEIAPITIKAGEILQNSIKINELTPSKREADSSYILIGAAQNSNGELCIVRSVINKFSNELDTMDVLYAINAKKGTAVLNAPLVSTPNYRTTISIAQLLDFVNTHFPDILPESVLRHYGYDARPEGKMGEDALYSDRDFPNNAEDVAKEYFGTTKKWSETGYLLKDGTQLDFSGRHWQKYDSEIGLPEAYYNGKRNSEHYEIADAFPEYRDVSDMEHRGEILYNFLKRGNIRIVGKGLVELYTQPTEEQYERLYNYFRETKGQSFYIGIGDERSGARDVGGLSFAEGTDASIIIEGIRDYFAKNRSHQSDLMRFHTEFSDADIHYSIREEAPPKNTKEGYKVFVVKNGKLYPPMVANPNAEDTPVGVWLNADEGTRAPDSKTGRPQVKAGGKGTQGGSGSLAYRPGWHLGETPLATQFDRLNPETGIKELFPENFVWALCDIAADHDYQEEAMSYGYTKSGKFQHSLAGLPKLPKDGFYKYRTNPNPDTVPWLITGAMKVKKLLSDAEVNAILEAKGLSPKQRVGGNKTLADLGLSEYEDMVFSDRDTDTVSNRTLLANALESIAQNDIEKNKLKQYKDKIALIESAQAKLSEIKAKANELRFTKGRSATETKQMRDLDAEATRIANRINTYDKQLLDLESTTALKGVLAREKAQLRKRLEQKGKEALKAQKQKDAETIRTLMQKHTESRKKAIEGRHKTELRNKIKDVVSKLNTLLLNPTKEQHVPIGLQLVVSEALDAINMDGMNAGERVAYYNDLISKSSDPDEIAMLTKKRDFFEYRDANFKERITALKNAYADIKNDPDPLVQNAHHQDIEDLIENTADAVKDTSLKDMSYEQLEAVHNMYKAVLATVRKANQAFFDNIKETIAENGEAVKSEVKEVGGHKDRVLKIFKFIKKFGWNMLKPVTAMKVIGSKTFEKLFGNVRAGEDTWATDVNEAKAFYNEISKKYGYKKWDFKKRYTFKDSAGQDISLSLEQIMSLYAYSKRDQADKHLDVGGFVFDDSIEVVEKKFGIPLKYDVNDANPYRLKKADLLPIIDSLTEEQKGFVDEMQTYLSEVMGAKGNEVSLAMYDIKLYNEKNYFPLKTARYFREFDPEKGGTPKIKNSGFSKKTMPHAGNPIILSNFMDVWASHVNDMSMYHAFVLPLEDFMRVFNYKTTAGGYDSVQQYIKNAYGAQANQYIERLMDDLNGGARVDSSADVINKGISLFKKASVFASASVVIQQPSAIARAFAYINPKYFVTSAGSALNLVKHKSVWEEIKKYAPVAVIKEMGYFDTGMGKSTVEWIKGNKTIKDKVDDALAKAPAMADELSWSYIWLAVKNEIKSTTNLKVGSEEFLKKAAERFTEIVTNTQVYDSVLSRSGMMRSKDTGMKMATAFMAEPTTTVNMMVDGIMQGKRGNKKFAASTVGAVSASIILNSILVSLVYAARDDDEDETYAEKYIGSLTTELVDGFNPLTYIPFVKDIWSIAQGYDVERSDMSVISNLWETIEGLFSDKKSGWEKVADVVGAVSSLFGLPLKNILRDAKGLYNLFATIASGTPTTGAGIGDSIGDALRNSVPLLGRFYEDETKSDKLYDAIVSGDSNQINRIKGQYKSDKDFESAMRAGLRANDSRIHEAAQARLDGDLAKYTRIAKEIIAEGNFSQDTVVGAINAEMSAIKKGETIKQEPTEEKDEATSIYSGSDINSAFENGDNSLALEIINDLIATKVANGMDEKSARSSLRSSMTSYWKPLYKRAYQSGDTSEMARIRQILFASGLYGTANDVVKTAQNWLRD